MASNSGVATLRNFCRAQGPQKCLLGSSPNPLYFGTNCPKAPAAKMLTASHGNRAGHRNIHLPQKRALKSLVISEFRMA